MEQFDFWKGTEDSVFDSEVASALESLGDLEAEAEEKRKKSRGVEKKKKRVFLQGHENGREQAGQYDEARGRGRERR